MNNSTWEKSKEKYLTPAVLPGCGEPLSYQELQMAVALSGRMLLKYTIEQRILYRHYNAEALFGLPQVTKDYPDCIIKSGLVSKESQGDLLAFFDGIHRGVSTGSCDIRLFVPIKGEYRWFHADYSSIYNEQSIPVDAIISLYDNTLAREKDIAYKKWQTNLEQVLQNSQIYTEFNLTRDQIDRAEGVVPGSPGARADCTLEEFVEYGVNHLVAEADAEGYRRFLQRERLLTLFYGGTCETDFEYRGSVDETKWYHANIQMVEYPYNNDVKGFMVFTDITSKKQAMAKLSQQASRDALTGLLNRGACQTHIIDCLTGPNGQMGGALFMIDLDNFKKINDIMGHQQGDVVLSKAGIILKDEFRSSDIVGRFGGDEFLAFLPGMRNRELAANKAKALVRTLTFWVDQTRDLQLTISVGVVVTDGETTFNDLYERVDQALYCAKHAGKNQYKLLELVAD